MDEIQVLDDKDLGKLVGIIKRGQLENLICNYKWCPGNYTNPEGRRTIANWKSIKLLVYDVDNNMSIVEAFDVCNEEGWEAIIGTSPSHKRIKHKGKKNEQPAVDRFRIVLFLNKIIESEELYKSTWQYYSDKYFPAADPACKDVSRYYNPCKKIRYNIGGMLIDPVEGYLELATVSTIQPNTADGKVLWKSTYEFLTNGAGPGYWHDKFYKAARNIRDVGYTQEAAETELTKAAIAVGNSELDKTDLNQIKDAYSRPQREKYNTGSIDHTPYHTTEDLLDMSFDYLADKELMQGEPTNFEGLDKLLNGGLKLGELMVLLSDSKTGKSTLFDQLIFNYIDRGISVGYASREMRPAQEVLPHMFNLALKRNILMEDVTPKLKKEIKQRVEHWPIYFSKGSGTFVKDDLEVWLRELYGMGVTYFFMDHFHYMLENSDELHEITSLIQFLKKMVNELNICIFLIVQPTKIPRDEAIGPQHLKGGSVIGQTLDTLFILRRLRGNDNVNELEIAKKRNLMVKLGKIHLQYDPVTTILTEVIRERDKNKLSKDDPFKHTSRSMVKNFSPHSV